MAILILSQVQRQSNCVKITRSVSQWSVGPFVKFPDHFVNSRVQQTHGLPVRSSYPNIFLSDWEECTVCYSLKKPHKLVQLHPWCFHHMGSTVTRPLCYASFLNLELFKALDLAITFCIGFKLTDRHVILIPQSYYRSNVFRAIFALDNFTTGCLSVQRTKISIA